VQELLRQAAAAIEQEQRLAKASPTAIWREELEELEPYC